MLKRFKSVCRTGQLSRGNAKQNADAAGFTRGWAENVLYNYGGMDASMPPWAALSKRVPSSGARPLATTRTCVVTMKVSAVDGTSAKTTVSCGRASTATLN